MNKCKIALNRDDDKRLIRKDGITTLARGFLLLDLPFYIAIFCFFHRFRRLIKAMTEIDEIFAFYALSETEDPSTEGEPCTSKREFLVDIINLSLLLLSLKASLISSLSARLA